VSEEIVTDYELRYALVDDFQGRVIIPIVYQGKIVGYQGRAILPKLEPKYRFNEGFTASHFLFNFDRAVSSDVVVIMEGVFDAFRSIENAVALFTNQMSVWQKTLIVRAGWKRAIVMLDRDEREAALKIKKSLGPLLPTKVAHITSKDPGSATPQQLRDAIRTADGGISVR
jgi:DNA primase